MVIVDILLALIFFCFACHCITEALKMFFPAIFNNDEPDDYMSHW